MYEEAFDEVFIFCEDGMALHVTGGYGRGGVGRGIGRLPEDDWKVWYIERLQPMIAANS